MSLLSSAGKKAPPPSNTGEEPKTVMKKSCHIRNGLLGSHGVPLGLLSSGFQLNSVAYMFSTESWGGAISKHQGAVGRLPLVLGILAAFALANLAAITMIPRLNRWPLRELEPQVFPGLTTNTTLADLHNPANYTEFYFSALRHGYGYGFRGILIYIAVAVLLIHVALALAHVAIVVASGLSRGCLEHHGRNNGPYSQLLRCRATSQCMCWCE